MPFESAYFRMAFRLEGSPQRCFEDFPTSTGEETDSLEDQNPVGRGLT
jgi:hypothetical protein